jgi:sRNA-binding carbon storage regulator CsrA
MGESIDIADGVIKITFSYVDGDSVFLSVEAPFATAVLKENDFIAMHRENVAAFLENHELT